MDATTRSTPGRLPPGWRKALLTAHIATSAGPLGTDASVVPRAAHPGGLFRHWWVALKLALATAGAVLALAVLRPTVADLAGAARAGAGLASSDRLELLRDAGSASVVLLVAVVLSVAKPFGRRGRRG
jgi:hypothetical protein